ncbi:MAG: MBL fold metallo-hydrolase [Bacteroidota bacterium]|nr:MBL fold metallo-hydrolase [Bacteroidota bacterium]
MHRRIFFQKSMLTLGALSLGKQKILRAMRVDPWKITMLTNEIGIFTEKGGTIAFHFSKDGITVIDAQFPDTAPHLIAELKKRKDEPFRLLINTHHHGDHTSGNIAFKGVTDRVLAHENSLTNQKRVAIANKNEDKQYYPNQTFSKEWNEDIGKEKVGLYYYGAAHTNGDAVIHFKHANIVHVGDLVFNRRHPFVDRSAGANMQSWIKVLDATLKKFDKKTIFVCGHSGENYDVKGSKDMLLSFQDYLGNVLKLVDREIKAGKSKDEILKATEIPGSPEWKGDGIERPLTAAYEEITNA